MLIWVLHAQPGAGVCPVRGPRGLGVSSISIVRALLQERHPTRTHIPHAGLGPRHHPRRLKLVPGLPPGHEPSPARLGGGGRGHSDPCHHPQWDPSPAGARQCSQLQEKRVTGRMEICLISDGKSSGSSRGLGSPCQANMFKSNCSFSAPKFTRCFFQTLIKTFCRPPCTAWPPRRG